MSEYANLLAQQKALAERIETVRAEGLAVAFDNIQAIVESNGITHAELAARFGVRARKSSPGSHAAKHPPKFRDPASGATWSGKGRKPGWFTAGITQGRTEADFAIQ